MIYLWGVLDSSLVGHIVLLFANVICKRLIQTKFVVPNPKWLVSTDQIHLGVGYLLKGQTL